MIEVSFCMIVKDEEAVLERCLLSVKNVVDEIIIVDTGSTDCTKEIAKKYTDKIFDFKWTNDFSAARNYSFSKATKNYIFWLDADDILEREDQQSFLRLKSEIPPEVDSVMMKYHVQFDEYGEPTGSTMRNRLVKREKNYQWKGKVHEYLDVHGVIAKSNTSVYHKKLKTVTERNLKIYKERMEKGEAFSPRDLFYYANELASHAYYKEAIKIYEDFLSTKEGWLEDNIASCIQMANCFGHLHEKEKQIHNLFRTFHYDKPRSEVCCRLGEIFLNDYKDCDKAIFWYNLSLSLDEPPFLRGLFNEPHTRTWLPHMQLSVCYTQVGALEKAIEHCEKALEYHPENLKIKYNLLYLRELLDQQSKREGGKSE